MEDNSAHFAQKEVVALIVQKGITKKELFENKWLDVETLFEKAGWIVGYDSPGFNESYEATFTFTAKRKK